MKILTKKLIIWCAAIIALFTKKNLADFLISKVQLYTEATDACLKTAVQSKATKSVTECALQCKIQDKTSLMKDGYCYCVNEGCDDVNDKYSIDGNALIFKYRQNHWERMTIDGPICYDGKSIPAKFYLQKSGTISKFKLVHSSGAISCNIDFHAVAHWGCANLLLTCITNENDGSIFPVTSVPSDSRIPSSLVSGYDSNSQEIIFPAPNKVSYHGTIGETLKVWYSQALIGWTIENNVGTHCVHVFAMYDD